MEKQEVEIKIRNENKNIEQELWHWNPSIIIWQDVTEQSKHTKHNPWKYSCAIFVSGQMTIVNIR